MRTKVWVRPQNLVVLSRRQKARILREIAMKFEHFWYALTNGDGYVFKRSPKVLDMLKEYVVQTSQGLKKIPTLQLLEELPPKKGETYTWLPAEQIVAVSQIESAVDSTGRRGVRNHTFLLPIKQYIGLTVVFTPRTQMPSENVLETVEVT